jgi:hypothetical protein
MLLHFTQLGKTFKHCVDVPVDSALALVDAIDDMLLSMVRKYIVEAQEQPRETTSQSEYFEHSYSSHVNVEVSCSWHHKYSRMQ